MSRVLPRARSAATVAKLAMLSGLLVIGAGPGGLVHAERVATGLLLPFPPLRPSAPVADAALFAERVELGRLLFFDPILSGGRDLSCAHCHHPDRGFSDGRTVARGRALAPRPRNTPTLYNVGYRQRLFWDGRAASLEEQVRGPLLSSHEMNADPEELSQRLRSIPGYRTRFAAAFPAIPPSDESTGVIGIDSVVRAIADFERTLVSRDSRYDRFAAGDRAALTSQERRGLNLFRSLNTRCFECHRLPTFDAPLLVGIGVPSDDPGRAGITGVDAQIGQFAVPTLRNVAVTAPYMHDGSMASLREVVDFYREGGGRARGVPDRRVHEHVRPFDISDEEADALVAFLGALTDESARPEIPERVPSALPVLLPRELAGATEILP